MTTTYLERMLDPWREFDRMSRLFDRASSESCGEFPAVNVWVNGENAIVTTEIPGVGRDSIEISVEGNKLTFSGSRSEGERKVGESWQRHELWHGDFKKTIRLTFNIDGDKVHATYQKGILKIELPQLEADKPKKIEINS